MFDQVREDTLFCMVYAAVAMLSLTACCYLLFLRGNAIAPDVTSSVCLRRWAAAFLGSITLSHFWFMPPTFFLTSHDDIQIAGFVGGLLDCMTFFPLAIIVLLTMLQDRRRLLWSVWVMVMPLVVGVVWCVINQSNALLPVLIAYLLLMSIGLTIYMVRALRQYGRWLRDNYADLEHKELWQSFVVLAIILLVFAFYVFSNKYIVYEYFLQAMAVVLISYLLWRVEMISDLSISQQQSLPVADSELLQTAHDSIGLLLQKHCIGTQLYLQDDLTVSQLAQAVGVNRLYLSQYFSRQGMSYNAYINDLRIQHFVRLYREAVAAQSPFTAQQLASESGYRSYSTFSLAFKQRTGQSVTVWMRESGR